jgi:hypothetical protein
MALNRLREYIHQPYSHPGEGKLVRKLGEWQMVSLVIEHCTDASLQISSS